VDAAAEAHATVFVSGGRRGLEIELAPADLVLLTGSDGRLAEHAAWRVALRDSTRSRSEMTKKADFNAEEWGTLAEGPLLAALQVIAAERGGTIRESLAVGKAYAEARRHQGESELLDELVASPPSLDPSRLREGGGDVASVARTRLPESVAIVDAKATEEERRSYKDFVLAVAEAAAAANREGGFIGIGGKPVSANEQAALDEIRATLGT
jgi:hypothetical protein